MSDEGPPEVGWLHYRLAVAFCSAVVTCVMLLIVPLVWAMGGGAPEPLVLYKFVFSKWGAAILLGASVLGFVVGGERMANAFSVIWGTHPFWSELEDWLYDHESIGVFLALSAAFLIVGFFWYAFR